MRILAGLTGLVALAAFSIAPAMAECDWMKTSQTKMSPVASAELPQTSLATNDLTDELVKAGQAEARDLPGEKPDTQQ
jgi:hypothetical protein